MNRAAGCIIAGLIGAFLLGALVNDATKASSAGPPILTPIGPERRLAVKRMESLRVVRRCTAGGFVLRTFDGKYAFSYYEQAWRGPLADISYLSPGVKPEEFC